MEKFTTEEIDALCQEFAKAPIEEQARLRASAKQIVKVHADKIKIVNHRKNIHLALIGLLTFAIAFEISQFIRGTDLSPMVWFLTGFNTVLLVLQIGVYLKLLMVNTYMNDVYRIASTISKEENHDH